MTARTSLLTLLLCLAMTGISNAAVVGFTFVFDDGPLEGQTESGTFEVDGSVYSFYRANTGFLSLDSTVEGHVFSITDDTGYADYPMVSIHPDNSVFVFDYSGEGEGSSHLYIHLKQTNSEVEVNIVEFGPNGGEDSLGHVTSFVLLSTEPGGIKNYVPGSGGIGGFKFEPKAPSSPSVNRELAARARKYGVSVSELFSSRGRGRCTRSCEANGSVSEQQQR